MKVGTRGNSYNELRKMNKNRIDMKKILLSLIVSLLLTSCYEDYVKDNDYNAVYFAYQTNVRTVVVGEGMKFKQGIVLAGIIDNMQDREVYFKVDNSLVNSNTLNAMKNHSFTYIKDHMKTVSQLNELDANLYSLLYEGTPANKVVIKKGAHTGFIEIRVDSAQFLSDVSKTTPHSVIPLMITKADADLIYEGKESTVIGVRYENMLFGNYWHGGKTIVKDALGTVVETIEYPTAIPQPDNRTWNLKTVAPFELEINAVGSESSTAKSQFRIELKGDGSIDVHPVAGGSYQVEADGDSYYNRAKLLQDRKIFLSYKYEKEGNVYHATDTLTFRNRIRDGVNEWQDENPNNYK